MFKTTKILIVFLTLLSSCGIIEEQSQSLDFGPETKIVIDKYKVQYDFKEIKVLILPESPEFSSHLIIDCENSKWFPLDYQQRKLLMQSIAEDIFKSFNVETKERFAQIHVDFTVWKTNRLFFNSGKSEIHSFKVVAGELRLLN